MKEDNLETNLIEKQLSQDNFLNARLNKEESEIYNKSGQKLCVFDYSSVLTDAKDDAKDYVDNFIETKTLEISNNSDFRVIGWNKNSIFFLKD